MIKICVPGRFEQELLDGLEPLQAETGRIHEVYGSLPRSVVGSARPTRRLVEHAGTATFADVRRFTERAHRSGIEVNYVLNASTLNHREYTRSGRDEILRYVGEVADSGVDRVTITVPYLIELVRSEFPELPVSVSVICEVDSAHMLRLFEQYGVERVFLAEECNRDMELLEHLSDTATAGLGLLLNNGCLRYCHMRAYHFLLASQASQSDKPADRYVDYPLLKCSAERARNPVEILRAPWIRPEDLPFYEERFGIRVFKIVGRQLPLESILRIAAAYARLGYEGNFLDLLSTPQAANFARHPTTAEAAAARGAERYVPPELHIDNARLGKLTRAIFARGGCGPLRDCESCGLCDELLDHVMTVDHERERLAHARALDGLITDLAAGEWSAEDPGSGTCPAFADAGVGSAR